MVLQKTNRIHSLDSLRAIMMLLGLFLHTALTYSVADHQGDWILKDPNSTHLFNDIVVFFIHSFRMPIFFIIAGFFGAMLFYERGVVPMIKNRLKRITLPFVVFLFLLWPIYLFTLIYTNTIFVQQPDALGVSWQKFVKEYTLFPPSTFHLWFLYYLTWISGMSITIGLLARYTPKINSTIKQLFNWIIQRAFVRVGLLSAFVFLTLIIFKKTVISNSDSFNIKLDVYIVFSVFYLVGWLLFKTKKHLNSLSQNAWLCTILGIILASAFGLTVTILGINPNDYTAPFVLMHTIFVSLLTFGITGLFIRYANKYSKTMRYISDSSYWVYLIHLPLTTILPAFICHWPLSAIAKFFVVSMVSAVISFLSYHYFVRNTAIGKFLNGRKYARTTKI